MNEDKLFWVDYYWISKIILESGLQEKWSNWPLTQDWYSAMQGIFKMLSDYWVSSTLRSFLHIKKE